MGSPSKKYQERKSKGGPKFNQSSKKSFKSKKEQKDPVKSEAVALHLQDDVPDFPRGWLLKNCNFILYAVVFLHLFYSICFVLPSYTGLTGGGNSLSRRERDIIRTEVDAEFEAEEQELKQNKRKNGKSVQKKSLALEDELGSLFGDGITGKLPRYANKITLKVYC